QQIKDAGLSDNSAFSIAGGQNSAFRGSFTMVDRKAVEVLARDTVGDLVKAAESLARTAATALRHMAATGVTKQEVNQILAGRAIIEGKPDLAIKELKALLEKVHGETVTIIDKNGDPIEFDTGTYARMVANTKTREAVCQARHERLSEKGIDLVQIVGRVSKNFCTAYLGKVYSLSGTDPKYPPLSSLPGGRGPFPPPPFHPNCSKSTAPFIAGLASKAALKVAAQTSGDENFLNENNQSKLQKTFINSNQMQIAAQRQKNLVEDIRSRAIAAGYQPPPYGRP
ncbi:MAG: phage minor capsid protein, partial [Phycisphaerae bacterium]